MALVKCPKCGNRISSKAIGCPKCGCNTKSIILKKFFIFIITLLVLLSASFGIYWYVKEETCVFGHEWKAATCQNPKTCEKCGITEGKTVGHQYDEFVVVYYPTTESTGRKEATCKICGHVKHLIMPKIS